MRESDTVVPYGDQWPSQFAALSLPLAALLKGVTHSIELVGSTSVPGLASKPVIDIDVVVDDSQDIKMIVSRLVNLGDYRHQGELGVAGRHAFASPTRIEAPTHHLYAVARGGQPHRDHIDLRNYLRRHPNAADLYGHTKLQLAHFLTTDRPRYFHAKRELIEQLLVAAQVHSLERTPLVGKRAARQ